MTFFQRNEAATQRAHELIPYTDFIGLEVGEDDHGNSLFALPFAEQNIGNFFLPALHGGLIGGFMESCAVLFLYNHAQMSELPKMVDFSLDYLRSGKSETSYGKCVLTRQGSRITNVAIEVWQNNPDKPIAMARTHFQMPPQQKTNPHKPYSA